MSSTFIVSVKILLVASVSTTLSFIQCHNLGELLRLNSLKLLIYKKYKINKYFDTSIAFFFRLIEIYKRKETRTKREGGHRPKPSQARKVSKNLGAKRHIQQRVETKRQKIRRKKIQEKNMDT